MIGIESLDISHGPEHFLPPEVYRNFSLDKQYNYQILAIPFISFHFYQCNISFILLYSTSCPHLLIQSVMGDHTLEVAIITH